MYHKFNIGETDLCACSTASMTAEHLLQDCPTYNNEKKDTWQQLVTINDKLYRVV
jgi:hypothetical protein